MSSTYPYTRVFAPTLSVTETHRRRWGVLLFVLVLLGVVSLFSTMIPDNPSYGAPLTVVMADSRAPHVPNEGEDVPYWTITALLNYQYAREHGADFVYIVYQPDHPPTSSNSPVCTHPRLGARAASWCKLPAVWEVLRTRSSQNVMFLDTDAIFRSTTVAPSRHLDHLTPFRPIGFVSNQPWNDGVCAGYFFVRREAASFLKAWWDQEVPRKNLHRLWEQEALDKLLATSVPHHNQSLANPPYADQIVKLASERQFKVEDPQQLILHITSEEANRYALIRDRWDQVTSLKDRDGLRALLDQVPIVRMNASAVAVMMEEEV
ncbi:uncharacterized protein LOC62_05G007434 [Vanrija pseudolonga]|uniref:Nucleotide-diphospho-sugar transferase domain-containing protein n=1 Tax=Vanrija pseudolonga TaxID=143232 RepID=A0AAF0YFH1_9TREE|nr:hypothetical protein LOC62_05G007434 [Vanrija pseudolonga]